MNIVSMKMAPNGNIPPASITKWVCKNHFYCFTGLGILLTLQGKRYTSDLWPIPLPKKASGTEIPNHKIKIAIKVPNGTAPLLLSKINKKLRVKKTRKHIPGNIRDVINAFAFQFYPRNVL